MINFARQATCKLHDYQLQRSLQRDEDGLTMLAYALGAAVIIVPLAAAVFAFGQDAVNEAGTRVDGALATA